ncbi:AAA family ATPase [Archangium violaceum]|uniref:AAA family ATPase n=1 Tax=Archangium violaceum TaxID=83451 RepID=UPI001952992F|nr:AAA family ATPase [Archangium violaceum]QRN96922.1 AAA family ATPase [Archangium violaceum]
MASSPALPRPGSPATSAPWLEELDILIRARYPLLYLVSWEEHRVDTLLADMARAHGKALLTWSTTRGLRHAGGSRGPTFPEDTRNPLEALAAIEKLSEPSLVVLKDFHPYLEEKPVVRALRELAHFLKSTFTTVILLSPTLTIPTELEKEISVLDVPLPGFQELLNLLKEIVAVVRRGNKATIELSREDAEQLIKAAQGLTLSEAENAFAKAIAHDGKLSAADIRRVQDEKRQVIRKSGLLEYYPPEQDLGNVGGLQNLKGWLTRRTAAFGERARQFGLPEPRGLLLLGVQGCGKSLTAKAISAHWNLPLLRLDMGRIFSGLVGSSEENLRKAIRVAESIAPVVLWVDEIEKGLSGVASSGTADGGVTARVFGTLLTWLQEKTAPVFVVATANRIEGLPPELLRKGRFDEIFFIDLPEAAERRDIFRIHLQRRKREPAAYDLHALADMASDFSGAEIEQVVIAGLYEAFAENVELGQAHLTRAIQETFPLAVTMRDEILRLREWARGRTRPASSSVSGSRKE